jgi:predicted PP-loop superfamily ATPase
MLESHHCWFQSQQLLCALKEQVLKRLRGSIQFALQDLRRSKQIKIVVAWAGIEPATFAVIGRRFDNPIGCDTGNVLLAMCSRNPSLPIERLPFDIG